MFTATGVRLTRESAGEQYGFPNNAYRLILWSNLPIGNMGGLWVGDQGGGFRLPIGFAIFQWHIMAHAGFGGSNPQFVAKLIKNASLVPGTFNLDITKASPDIAAAVGCPGAQLGTATAATSVTEMVTCASDLYQLFLYSSAMDPSVGTTMDGNKAHSYFSVTSFGAPEA